MFICIEKLGASYEWLVSKIVCCIHEAKQLSNPQNTVPYILTNDHSSTIAHDNSTLSAKLSCSL